MSNMFLIILLSAILFSCAGEDKHSNRLEVSSIKNEAMQEKKIKVDTVRLSKDIDSVEVTCIFSGKHREFILNFSDMNFYGFFRRYEEKKIIINSLEKRNRFVNYINRFYIEKEKIIFSKKKTGYIRTINGYPTIIVKLFRKDDLILEQENEIGSETHKVEYNPKFIEFYEFLEELVSE